MNDPRDFPLERFRVNDERIPVAINRRTIFLYVVKHIDKTTQVCDRTVEQIATGVKMDRDTVREHLRILVDLELLEILKHRPLQYKVLVPIPALPESPAPLSLMERGQRLLRKVLKLKESHPEIEIKKPIVSLPEIESAVLEKELARERRIARELGTRLTPPPRPEYKTLKPYLREHIDLGSDGHGGRRVYIRTYRR
jgi:DNA-binding transcriptional ArsR family regulator